MYSAESLGNQPSCVFHKLVGESREEEIRSHDTVRHCQSCLSLLKVKVAEQVLQESGDRVGILVILHLDDPCEVFDVIPVRPHSRCSRCSTGDDGGGDEVSEEMRAGGLDSVEIRGGKEHFE